MKAVLSKKIYSFSNDQQWQVLQATSMSAAALALDHVYNSWGYEKGAVQSVGALHHGYCLFCTQEPRVRKIATPLHISSPFFPLFCFVGSKRLWINATHLIVPCWLIFSFFFFFPSLRVRASNNKQCFSTPTRKQAQLHRYKGGYMGGARALE